MNQKNTDVLFSLSSACLRFCTNIFKDIIEMKHELQYISKKE